VVPSSTIEVRSPALPYANCWENAFVPEAVHFHRRSWPSYANVSVHEEPERVVAIWVTSPALRAQESDRPMSEAELISLVNAKTLEDRLIEMVRARGVAFKPSAALDEGLRKLKLTRLLATLTEPGTLEVTVNVPGADVLVDGEKRGAAGPDGRALVSDVAPGEHSLDVRAESYVEASQKFLLKPGETRRLERGEIENYATAQWFRDGNRVLICGNEPGKGTRARRSRGTPVHARDRRHG